MSIDRGFTWQDDETISLLEIYAKEDSQQDFNGCKRNGSVYERIALEMTKNGFRRNANQCREKMKRLRKEYSLAKYCQKHDITNKKPMKHFEVVDKIFNRDIIDSSTCIDFGLLSSEFEEELHFSFSQDPESDASNSCSGIEPDFPHSILPGPSSSPEQDHDSSIAAIIDSKNSPTKHHHTDSNDAFLLNGEPPCCPDSPLDDPESPWVPNVVLVENEMANSNADKCSAASNSLTDSLHQDGPLNNGQGSENEKSDSQEPPPKRKKLDTAEIWFKKTLDRVTDVFLQFHEKAESRFLQRVSCLEQERRKRDEKLQTLWLEFEERRRKDEHEHQKRMLKLLSQFVSQISHNENNNA